MLTLCWLKHNLCFSHSVLKTFFKLILKLGKKKKKDLVGTKVHDIMHS